MNGLSEEEEDRWGGLSHAVFLRLETMRELGHRKALAAADVVVRQQRK